MPNSNGRIYTETRNGITYGVSTDDAAQTLGVVSHDIGYLCSNRHNRTNKWAKYKPVEIDELDIDLQKDVVSMPNPFTLEYDSYPAWLGRIYTESVKPDGTMANEILIAHIAGMGVPMISGTNITTAEEQEYTAKRVKNVIDHIEAWGVNWEYAPQLGPSYPSRLNDFNGYDHYARCPITYTVSEKIYNGEYAWFQCCLIPEGQTALDVAVFSSFFIGFKICVAWFRGDSYRGFQEIEPLESGRGETVMTPQPIFTLTGENAGEYKAYFFATNGDRSIIFPTLPENTNPMSFTAIKGNNPRNDPFASFLYLDIYASGTGFAHEHRSSYFESYYNVGEGDYVALCTTGYYCVKAKVVNTTKEIVKFDPTKFSALWDESGGSPVITVYDESGKLMTEKPEVPASGSIFIFLEFMDIYLGMTPEEGKEYGFIDSMKIKYDGVTVLDFLCDVIYDQFHNSYFKIGADYYYTTR